MKKTPIIFAFALVVLIILGLAGVFEKKQDQNNQPKEAVTVGLILPLTGPAASWGEDFLNGASIAFDEIGEDARIDIVSEDSEADPSVALSAYNKLRTADDADILVSLLSRVSVPLGSKANQDGVPLFMTLVSSDNALQQDNEYVFRMFNPARQTGRIHFEEFKKQGFEKISILYVNDEFGVSVARAVEEQAEEDNINLESFSFSPNDNDYRTQIAKIKNTDSDGVIFVGIAPSTLASFLNQANELSLGLPVFDSAGTLANPEARQILGESAEGIFSYGNPFDVRESGEEFFDEYQSRYSQIPGFGAAYAYDLMYLLNDYAQQPFNADDFVAELKTLDSFEGVNGEYLLDGEGEINAVIYPVQLRDGELERL